VAAPALLISTLKLGQFTELAADDGIANR
jgi:hypothetical protein